MSDGTASRPVSADGDDVAGLRGSLAVVLLPTLNEVEGLARTLSDLAIYRFDEPGHPVRILIVDGGSTDGTLGVARESGVPVLTQTSRGKGGAMLEAITRIHRLGVPYVVTLDADATYPPDGIVPALDLLGGGADLVIGVRHRVWGPPHDLKDLIHRVGNAGLSFAASFLTRRSILDLCSGFWGVSTQRFMQLGLTDSSFAIEAELVLKSIRQGHTVRQIPVDYRERVGTAKLRTLRDGSKILRTILRQGRSVGRDPAVRERPALAAPVGDTRRLIRPGESYRGSLAPVPLSGVKADQIVQYIQRTLRSVETAVVPPPPMGPYVENRFGGISRLGAGHAPSTESAPIARWASIDPLDSGHALVAPNWSRSGGWMTSPIAERTRFPSLLVLTSRLNPGPERQLQTLLAANELMMVLEPPRSRVERS